MNTDSDRIPVSIITGFLGAGKTTLLNRLVSEYPEKKYAIIENEFGEIGIDSSLVVNLDKGNICELANGCICCTLNDDLAELLKDLLNSGKPFSHLLVETTGMADPSSVVQTFFSDFQAKTSFRMDSVICLADSLNFERSAAEQEEVLKQVAIADILLLNKASEQDPEELGRIRNTISRVNPHCEIHETDFAEVGGLNILDRFSYRKDRVEAFTLDVFRNGEQGKPGNGPGKPGIGQAKTESGETADRAPGRNKHTMVTSHAYRIAGAFDIEKFSYWIEYFLYINQSNVFRVKGILNFSGNPHRMILQSVRSSYELEDGAFWEVGEERQNSLVFIGKALDPGEIREALESLMA